VPDPSVVLDSLRMTPGTLSHHFAFPRSVVKNVNKSRNFAYPSSLYPSGISEIFDGRISFTRDRSIRVVLSTAS
jgi:hypothetical protein